MVCHTRASYSVLAVVLLLIPSSLNYVIRKRSGPNRYELSDALDALNRQRRRTSQNDYRRLGSRQSYVPYPGYNDLSLYSADSPPGKYTLADLLAQYPDVEYPSEEYGDVMQENSDRVPSLQELNDIFGKSEKQRNNEDISNKPFKSEVGISKAKMEQLLSEVEQEDENKADESSTEDQNGITEDKIAEKGTPEPEPVTKEEISELFSENNDDDKDTVKTAVILETSDSSTNKQTDDAEKSKEHSESSNDNSKVGENVPESNLAMHRKRKRVAKRDNTGNNMTSKTVQELLQELKKLRGEISRLKFIELLEDQENDFLALALKDATLAQLGGRENFLQTEYSDIQNAIDIEELLQDYKQENSLEDEVAEVEAEQEAEEEEAKVEEAKALEESEGLGPSQQAVKREDDDEENGETMRDDAEDPSFDDKMGRWYDKPVSDDDRPNRLIIDDDTMTKADADQILENFVKKFIKKDAEEQDIEVSSIPDEIEPPNNDVKNVISDYLMNMHKTPTKRLLPTSEICPAVEMYGDNCKVAESLGLPIDKEASNLCSRHKMCYECGTSIEMTKETCDGGFRAEVINLCQANKECIKDGAQFLWYIKTDHKYNYKYKYPCSDPCVKDFIMGL